MRQGYSRFRWRAPGRPSLRGSRGPAGAAMLLSQGSPRATRPEPQPPRRMPSAHRGCGRRLGLAGPRAPVWPGRQLRNTAAAATEQKGHGVAKCSVSQCRPRRSWKATGTRESAATANSSTAPVPAIHRDVEVKATHNHNREIHPPLIAAVMTGLVPTIHVSLFWARRKSWMLGAWPGMTSLLVCLSRQRRSQRLDIVAEHVEIGRRGTVGRRQGVGIERAADLGIGLARDLIE